MSSTIEVTLIRSGINATQGIQRTLRALKLNRLHVTAKVPDNAAQRGMIAKVAHLVQVKEGGK